MIKVFDNSDIEYSVGDTFNLPVEPSREDEFSVGMQLRFVVAESVQSTPIIDNTYNINENLTFNVVLSEADIKRLSLGEYVYKIITYKDNQIETEVSGFFTVKWGA